MTGLATFLQKIKTSIQQDAFVKLTLSKPIKKGEIKNIYGRIALIKRQLCFSFTIRYATKDVTKNFTIEAGLLEITTWLNEAFWNGHLFTTKENVTLEQSKKGKQKLSTQPPTFSHPTLKTHDKPKQRLVTADRPYLQQLGITNQQGKVLKNWQSKFKQINKYIEIIDGLLKSVSLKDTTHIVDMGSGKGYLTFALYDYLVHQLNRNITLTGIELRPHLVQQCNKIAQQTGFKGLQFVAQDIKDYPAANIDILIALHACDTATDLAMAKGILSNAQLIVCAPCCHKQVRKQMNCQTDLQAILKHGILEERQAEMITDGIRALLLEGHGYKSKVFEFISSEHTAKNLMVVGVKHHKSDKTAFQKIKQIKQQFGIQYQELEVLLENVKGVG